MTSPADVPEKAPPSPADNFETPFAPLRPPFSFWIQFVIFAIMGGVLGLLGLGYVKAIELVPEQWYQADGNDNYPDDPSTLQWATGKLWWIGVGAVTGVITGVIKVICNLDEVRNSGHQILLTLRSGIPQGIDFF